MKKTYSWGIVIAVLYFFFPVGIVLMVNKISKEKWRFKENGKALKIFGIVLLALIPVMLICGVTGNLEVSNGSTPLGAAVMMSVILAMMGLPLYFSGRKVFNKGVIYDHYLSLLPAQQRISLDEMARELKLTCKNVSDDLQCMINAAYLENAFIDPTQRCLIAKPVQRKMRHFVCPFCGGNNSVDIHAPMKCAYCDSPVEQ